MRALTLAAVAALVLLIPVSGGALSAAPNVQFNTTLLGSRTLDIGQKGPSIGDSRVRRWRLTNRAGNAMGFGYEVCHWASSTVPACRLVYDLPEGQIVAQGLIQPGVEIAVTGGTGAYHRASGHLVRSGRTVLVTL